MYKGTTKACLPTVKFPEGWHITCTHNHWCNKSTVKDYISKIIVLYLTEKKAKLKLPNNQQALAIIDRFRGQCTEEVLQLLQQHNIDIVYVPANCTGLLQPLDLSISKLAKDFLRGKFQEWYADQIYNQREDVVTPVKFPLKQMKSLGAQWMINWNDYILAHPEIKNGFRAAGITQK